MKTRARDPIKAMTVTEPIRHGRLGGGGLSDGVSIEQRMLQSQRRQNHGDLNNAIITSRSEAKHLPALALARRGLAASPSKAPQLPGDQRY